MKFHALATKAFKDAWRVVMQPDGKQVFVVLGACSPEDAQKYQASMMKDKVAWPKNTPINLAALKGRKTEPGAEDLLNAEPQTRTKPKAPPTAPNDKDDLAKAFAGLDPDAVKNQDVKALLKNPQTARSAEKRCSNQAVWPGLMPTSIPCSIIPSSRGMLESMLKSQGTAPKGKVDAGVYTNEKLGLTLHQPQAEGWQIDANPPQPPVGTVLLAASSAGHEAQVAISLQPLPLQIPIETFGPMSEMAPKMMMNDFKKIKGGFVQSGTQKGYEVEYEGHDRGPLRSRDSTPVHRRWPGAGRCRNVHRGAMGQAFRCD